MWEGETKADEQQRDVFITVNKQPVKRAHRNINMELNISSLLNNILFPICVINIADNKY